MDYFKEQRKSFIEIGNVYFWTATINSWIKLLEQDALKQIIINSLHYLYGKKKIEVYAFVIIPNHIHLIWKILEKNGKETAQGSFLKFTAHEFKKYLTANNPVLLQSFAVTAHNKKFEFWQRDSLTFQLFKRETALQKLDYLHNNPLSERWQLCSNPVDYYYSSAKFYEQGIDNFRFLKHIMDEF